MGEDSIPLFLWPMKATYRSNSGLFGIFGPVLNSKKASNIHMMPIYVLNKDGNFWP